MLYRFHCHLNSARMTLSRKAAKRERKAERERKTNREKLRITLRINVCMNKTTRKDIPA